MLGVLPDTIKISVNDYDYLGVCVMRIKCILIVAVSILPGCSNIGNVKPDFNFGPNPKVGLVVLSTVEDNRCTGLPLERSSTFYYSRISDADEPVWDIIVSNPFIKTDFSDPPGSLKVLSLEEGEYAFTIWVCNYGNRRITTPIMRPRFRVKSGEIIYLGEIHFLVPPDGKSVTTTISDKSERDLALFSKKMLNFSESDVRNLLKESISEQNESTMPVDLDSEEKPNNSEEK